MSESPNGMQSALNVYNDYCKQWKLTVNINKSKVVIFSKGRQANYSFVLNMLNDQILDIESDYNYLGVLDSKSGSFYSAKKQLVNQAERMYSLIRKSRSLLLPLDLQIELYENMVKPILLYGSEVCGFGNLDVLERSVLKFLKLILHMKSSTPNFMVYGETGVYPIYIDIYCRMISFWATLDSGPPAKLSYIVYRTAYSLYTFETVVISLNGFKRLKIFCVVVGLVEYGTIIRFPIKSDSSVQ